jgi:hypothetical protein
MKHLYKSLLLTGLLGWMSTQAHAQSCSQILRLARATYEQGRLHEVAALFEGKTCLTDNQDAGGLSKAEKVEAYRLLTLTYIYLEEPEKADETMLNLLRTDYYFEPNPAIDPAEFLGLYNTFRTWPIYRLGVRLGGAFTSPNVKDANPVINGDAAYAGRFSFIVGATGEIPLDRKGKFTFNPEIYFAQRSYTAEVTSQDVGVFTGIKRISTLAAPMAVQYKLFNKKTRFNPYVLGGVWPELMLQGTMTSATIRTGNESIIEQSIDIKDQLKTISFYTQVGAGIKYRAAGGYLTAEIRYLYGLNTINTNVYNNQALIWDYHWADGINRLNSVQLTVGYIQNFFNPKKLGNKK